MTYFIVHAPYEKCFDLFFQDELGFPNFYRLTELLADQNGLDPDLEQLTEFTVLAPFPEKSEKILEKISHRMQSCGVKNLPFGTNLETEFAFDIHGKLQTHAQFKQALHQATHSFRQMQ